MVMGNALSGGYTRTESNGQHTSTLDATTTDATGNYVVTQSTSGNFTRMETGNSVTGSYTKNEQGNDVYSSQETGTGDENFTLTISGSISYSDDETGNRVTGNYTRTKTGTDSFQIDVNGTKTGGTYSQTVMGIESFTLTDTGNLGTGGYARTIEGDGFYERTSTGDGATQPSDTGAIDYVFAQSADPHSGTFDASWTGTTRYDLLEDFDDISNTQPGRSPGHMNFYPFGQPFVDPLVLAVPAASTWELLAVGGAAILAGWGAYRMGPYVGYATPTSRFRVMNSDATRIVEFEAGRTFRPGAEISDEEAAQIVAAGGDVIAPSRERARRIAEMAGGGNPPIWEGPHHPGERPHYHPNPRTGGHVWYESGWMHGSGALLHPLFRR